MYKKIELHTIILIYIFLISGCGFINSNNSIAKSTPDVKVELTPSIKEHILEILTDSVKSTDIGLPTKTLIIEATYESSQVAIVTIEPTITANELLAIIQEKSVLSSECSFPCVWGFTPTDTNIEDLGQFMKEIGPNVRDDYDIDCNYRENVNDLMIAYYTGDYHFQLRLSDLSLQKGEFISLSIISEESTYQQLFSDYQIHSILEKYGNPSEIYIGPYPENSPNPAPENFDIILFYPQLGFLVDYTSLKSIDGNKFIGCINDIHNISFINWDPIKEKSIEDVILEFDNVYWSQLDVQSFRLVYQSIENSMTIDEFVNLFINPDNQECIRVPKQNWRYE